MQWQEQKRRKKKTAADLSKCEFAPWLEETIPGLIEFNPDSIAIIARSREKEIGQTAFWHCDIEDRAALAWHFISDMIIDLVRANKDIILDGNDEDDEEYDEDDEEG